MRLKSNQKLICAGQMPLRAPNGKQSAAVPVYKVISTDETRGRETEELAPNERLVLVGTTESKQTAEERYNALISGGMSPKACTEPLYIKDTSDASSETELTESEKRALNPLIADLLCEFSAAMQEQEAL